MKKFFVTICLFLWAGLSLAATEEGFSYVQKTDGAYYIKPKIKTGGDHFSPVDGPYGGMELRTAFEAAYTQATPLGAHPLLSGANLKILGGAELTPVTLLPRLGLYFTPVPFLEFAAGGEFGTGWNAFGFDGMGVYEPAEQDYRDLDAFKHYYWNTWASGTFQFDVGAIVPGEWTHVVMLATYAVRYEALTGVDDGEVWVWRESENRANGLLFDFTGVLGYKMPLRVKMIGVMFNAYGHYKGSDYGDYDATFDGDFVTYVWKGFADITLNKSNSLTLLGLVSSRRSFATPYEEETDVPVLVKTGREWYLDGIAFRWTHQF